MAKVISGRGRASLPVCLQSALARSNFSGLRWSVDWPGSYLDFRGREADLQRFESHLRRRKTDWSCRIPDPECDESYLRRLDSNKQCRFDNGET